MNKETFAVKRLPDGRRIDVVPLTYGRARIAISENDDYSYEDGY